MKKNPLLLVLILTAGLAVGLALTLATNSFAASRSGEPVFQAACDVVVFEKGGKNLEFFSATSPEYTLENSQTSKSLEVPFGNYAAFLGHNWTINQRGEYGPILTIGLKKDGRVQYMTELDGYDVSPESRSMDHPYHLSSIALIELNLNGTDFAKVDFSCTENRIR
jgi:hypothetical protein